jgi:hypothetical protein
LISPVRTWTLALVLVAAGRAFAAPEVVLERADTAAPPEVAEGIRAALLPGAFRLQAQGKPLLTIWLRKDVPAAETPRQDAGFAYKSVREGGLVGVVDVPEPWTNYRGRKVKPGVYTMRYAVQPADGNHTGITEYRDFLILVPASVDKDLSASYRTPELVELQKQATGYDHPGVLALFPVPADVTAPVLVKNELDQPMLAVKVGDATLGLVVLGEAEAEGY